MDRPVAIRRATRADLADIGQLGALLVRTHHEFDTKRFLPATPETPNGYAWWLGKQLEEARVIVLVAECEGRVVGYAYAGMEDTDYMALRGPAGALYDIIVDPAFRGRGIGRALLDAALAELKRRGAPRAVLSTAQGNDTAQRLFERAGFRRTMIEMTRELDD